MSVEYFIVEFCSGRESYRLTVLVEHAAEETEFLVVREHLFYGAGLVCEIRVILLHVELIHERLGFFDG